MGPRIPLRLFLLLVCLALLTPAAERSAIFLSVRMDSTGDISARAWSRIQGVEIDRVMAAVLGCPDPPRKDLFDQFHCPHALQRKGLSLEATINPAPLARQLSRAEFIQIDINHPVLGFTEAPEEFGAPARTTREYRAVVLTVTEALEPLHIRFGYTPDQLLSIYLPFALLAVLLIVLTAVLRRKGLAHLQQAVFFIGSILWFGLVWQWKAAEPLAILSGSLLPGAVFHFLTPLFCVSCGAAFPPKPQFQQTFWTFGVIAFPIGCAMAAVPRLLDNDWWSTGPWFAAAVAAGFYSRRRLVALGGATTLYLSTGPLLARVRELASRMGRRDVKVCVVGLQKSRMGNAFAMFPNTVVLTKPLLETLSRREVDAIVGHELTHLRDRARPILVPYIAAALLFESSLIDLLGATASVANLVLVILVVAFVGALAFSRRREYAADRGSLAIAADPRGLISGLTKLARFNQQPLSFGPLAEWFSTHPSTAKRVKKLAALSNVTESELETLSTQDQPGDYYDLPVEDTTAVFSPRWQTANATRYGWTTLLAPAAAAITAASLHGGLLALLLATAAAKALVNATMALGYLRFARRLQTRLGQPGIAVGLAPGPDPKVYDGYRFPDAGLLRLDGDLLRYRSERATLELRAEDILAVSLIPAAPSSWRRIQPLIHFRHPETGESNSVILHSLHWDTSGKRLFHRIEQWRRRAPSGVAPGRVENLVQPQGEQFRGPSLKAILKGLQIPMAITLLVTLPMGTGAVYSLAVLATAYLLIALPPMLYRPPAGQAAPAGNQPATAR